MLRSALPVFVMQIAAAASLRGLEHPTFRDPAFQFDRVGSICVMPLLPEHGTLDADADPFRPAVMEKLQRLGYSLSDPRCADKPPDGTDKKSKTWWEVSIRIEDISPVASRLVASLRDPNGKEVWSDDAHTDYLVRFANALLGPVTVKRLIDSGINPALATFERRNNRERTNTATPQGETWEPFEMRVALQKKTMMRGCWGIMRFDAGTMSFTAEESRGKCQKLEFKQSVEMFKWDMLYGFPLVSIPHVGTVSIRENNRGFIDRLDMRPHYFFIAARQFTLAHDR